MKKVFVAAIVFLFGLTGALPLAADVKIRQRVTIEGQSMEQTRMIKGARERSETKLGPIETGGGFSMPAIARITQCDLRRHLNVNDQAKKYFVEPFPEAAMSSSIAVKTPEKKLKGGTVTISAGVTDTGERKTIFGLTARRLIITQAVESSADSCGGAGRSRIEFDGWYADFSADFSCPVNIPEYQPPKPDCRDRVIFRQTAGGNPGFLLEGTMKTFDGSGKVTSSSRTETLEISRASLAASFFEAGADYREVDSLNALVGMPSMADFMKNSDADDDGKTTPARERRDGRKSLGIDQLTGDVAKINQDAIRAALVENFNSKGFAAIFVGAPAMAGGGFDFVVGVEIKAAKQSKAGKIGGMFGKMTGSTSAAKIGDSEAEVVVTVYRPDKKTIVAQAAGSQKLAGTPDDAVKAAVEAALDQLVDKLK